MEKITLEHQDLLTSYLEADRGYCQLFCTNPIWLAKGPFYFTVERDVLYLYKKTQIFGNVVFYHMGHPLTVNGDKATESHLTRSMLDDGVDFSLSSSQLKYLGIPDGLYRLDKTGPEYVYHSDTYGDLTGGNWKSWRQSIKKCQETLQIKIFTKNNLSKATPAINQILDKWKSHRDKFIGRHSNWYVDNAKNLNNPMVMVFTYNNVPVCFTISQLIGSTIYFLDEKTVRDELPNSFTISKAYHIFCIKYWQKVSGIQSLHMTSGTGEKEYKHDGKTFDLDKHKALLKPNSIEEVYKVRGLKNENQKP